MIELLFGLNEEEGTTLVLVTHDNSLADRCQRKFTMSRWAVRRGVMKSPIAASFRLLLRDWRGGELGVLFSALLLAVTVVVAISGFVNRLQFNLERESASFLAAEFSGFERQARPAGMACESRH